MRRYKTFMDGVRVSDTLDRRLKELKEPGKRPVPWAKYGSMAAALLLVVGLGTWWLSREEVYDHLVDYDPAAPENAGVGEPDIAIVEPGDVTEAGEKTIGGYEVVSGGIAAYYILPYIDYGGMKSSAAGQVAADWDIPSGAVKRDLTREEIAALLGGEEALSTHLDWDGYELSGWAAWYEDGSFWGAYIYGAVGPLDHFEFAVTANQLPPTCFDYPGSVTQEIRGLTVTANGFDSVAAPQGGVDGSDRRVSFMKDGYGYRFELTGTSKAVTEERVSRLVCRIAGQGVTCPDWDGSYTCANCGQTVPAGTKHSHPDVGVGEPNWNDSAPDQDTSGYDPNGAIETCPGCGASYPAGTEHDCAMCDGYPLPHTCERCGAVYPEGTAHDCQLCGYPLAPDTQTCPDCGVSYPAGEAHYHVHTCGICGETYVESTAHTHTCEVCGQTLTPGVEHSHQQHHQEEHHGSHH